MDESVRIALDGAARRQGWPQAKAEVIGQEYERFLVLAQEHPDMALVPALEVDVVWHEHLGRPGYGDAFPGSAPVHGEDTSPDHQSRFDATIALYRDRFGEPGEIWSRPAECYQVDKTQRA